MQAARSVVVWEWAPGEESCPGRQRKERQVCPGQGPRGKRAALWGPESAEGRHPVHLVEARGSRDVVWTRAPAGEDIVGGLLVTRASAGVLERDCCAS